MKNLNEGPEINIYPSCNFCKYFDKNKCSKLNENIGNYTNSHLFEPSDDCPFIEINKLKCFNEQIEFSKQRSFDKLKVAERGVSHDYRNKFKTNLSRI